tara:strand:+ start:3110 stop:4192 length:1083 start_codon:yes stop_codon:yes gene_type:complete
MATYKTIGPGDTTITTTVLHEAIPITGSILSGTYGTLLEGDNIKNFTHGMFQSVYDYPYLSSSANHILDITFGYSNNSALSASGNVQNSKKINMYNVHAQSLLGFSGSVCETFESDLDIGDDNNQMNEVFFIDLSRLLVKDGIKKQSFSMALGTGSWELVTSGTHGGSSSTSYGESVVVLTDASGAFATTVGGDYGVLYESNASPGGGTAHGVLFYDQGIVVLSASVFDSNAADWFSGPGTYNSGDQSLVSALTGAAISGTCDALRHRIVDLSFNNSVEINSTIYFCRAAHSDFNYSSNPTYKSGSQCVVKTTSADMPVSYITTVGLYNAANELLAVAKLSEPLRKDPTNELTLRVRLDY